MPVRGLFIATPSPAGKPSRRIFRRRHGIMSDSQWNSVASPIHNYLENLHRK